MNNKCKNLKQGFNKLKCKRTNKEITLSECINCRFYDRKVSKGYNYSLKSKSVLKGTKTPLKKVSKKREFVTKETYNATQMKCNNKCVLCGTNQELQLHHINGRGKDKTNNIDNCVMLCLNCHHNVVHKNNKYWRKELNKIKF